MKFSLGIQGKPDDEPIKTALAVHELRICEYYYI